MKLKIITFSVLILLLTVSFIFLFDELKSAVVKENFFEHIAKKYYAEEYEGVVRKKYIDSNQHLNKMIDIENRDIQLDYENPRLFEFIKVGDTITKNRQSLNFRLQRKGLDTIIRLSFSNIKNSEDYIDFLHELDSIYDR